MVQFPLFILIDLLRSLVKMRNNVQREGILLICNVSKMRPAWICIILIFEYYFPKDNDIIAVKRIRRFYFVD